ncbi:hypothetical protein EMN47_13285 [Prolixibacteraceae bacterium JC049]|nr:hypothetical protein [Prolixibacteraceae bacterium JC049]
MLIIMQRKYRRTFTVLILILLLNLPAFSQGSKSNWFRVPGFGPESPLTLTNQETFVGVFGAAVLSYTLAELVSKNGENTNYYQARTGMNNEYFWGYRKVFHQNFGVEKQVAPWFAFAVEGNLQQWSDKTPDIKSKDAFGIGAGIMTYYRWYLFGKKRISPYLEYGAGLFYGFKEFPYNGTNFTFNLSTQLGVEYKLKNKDKIRLGYGQFHQSNNNLLQPNPGYDGDGFSISYSWFWKNTKW